MEFFPQSVVDAKQSTKKQLKDKKRYQTRNESRNDYHL